MGMEHWWNDTDRGKLKYLERNLSQCHFVYHKSHMDCLASKPVLRGERSATDRLSHGTAYTYRNSSTEHKNLLSTSQKTHSLCLVLLWHSYHCYPHLKWSALCYRQHLFPAAAVFGFFSFSSSGAVRCGPLASNTVVIRSFWSVANVCQ